MRITATITATITPTTAALPAAHFTPWQAERRPCWHCTAFAGLTAGGSAARCTRPGAARVRSMPGTGCASFEREVGADDEPDRVPVG